MFHYLNNSSHRLRHHHGHGTCCQRGNKENPIPANNTKEKLNDFKKNPFGLLDTLDNLL